jgi:hypothetical protein
MTKMLVSLQYVSLLDTQCNGWHEAWRRFRALSCALTRAVHEMFTWTVYHMLIQNHVAKIGLPNWVHTSLGFFKAPLCVQEKRHTHTHVKTYTRTHTRTHTHTCRPSAVRWSLASLPSFGGMKTSAFPWQMRAGRPTRCGWSCSA